MEFNGARVLPAPCRQEEPFYFSSLPINISIYVISTYVTASRIHPLPFAGALCGKRQA